MACPLLRMGSHNELGWSVVVNLWSLLAVSWYRAYNRRHRHWLLFILPGGQELQDYGVFQEHDPSGTGAS